MELGHLLTRSGLTYPEVSSKVCHDSFCQLGNSVSLPRVIYHGAFYLHVVPSFSCIPVIFLKLVLFLIPLQFVHLFCNQSKCILLFFSCTRSDSKVMRLVPKKSFILFIHQLKYCHLQSISLVPAHTFSSGAAIVCSISGTQLEECCLRPALQTSGCLLLTENGVLSLTILFFWNKKKSQGVRSGE